MHKSRKQPQNVVAVGHAADNDHTQHTPCSATLGMMFVLPVEEGDVQGTSGRDGHSSSRAHVYCTPCQLLRSLCKRCLAGHLAPVANLQSVWQQDLNQTATISTMTATNLTEHFLLVSCLTHMVQNPATQQTQLVALPSIHCSSRVLEGRQMELRSAIWHAGVQQ